MTLNISVTPVIQSFPFIYVNVFPANNCLLLCGLYSFNCTSETNRSVSLTSHTYNPTFSSPRVRHSYCCLLPFCVFACRSQPHQTMASCPVLHGRWVLSRGEFHTLFWWKRALSSWRIQGFTCTNKNASICEKLLKNERAFPTIDPNCPKVPSMLGCWDILEVKESVQTVLSSVNYLWPDLSLRQWLHAWKNMLIVE